MRALAAHFGVPIEHVYVDTGYNILPTLEWNAVSDLKGRKISGAGLNLKWLEFAGGTPVLTTALHGVNRLGA